MPDVLGGFFDLSVSVEVDVDAVVGKIPVIKPHLGDIGGIGFAAYGNSAFEGRAAVVVGIPFFPGTKSATFHRHGESESAPDVKR